jgi:hypothetical protein
MLSHVRGEEYPYLGAVYMCDFTYESAYDSVYDSNFIHMFACKPDKDPIFLLTPTTMAISDKNKSKKTLRDTFGSSPSALCPWP